MKSPKAYQFCFIPQVFILEAEVCLKPKNVVQRRNPRLLHMIAILEPGPLPCSSIFHLNGLQESLHNLAIIVEFPLLAYHHIGVVLSYALENNGRVALLHKVLVASRIPDRAGATMIPLIKYWCCPCIEIHTDAWSGYNSLADEGFRHLVVVHK